MCKDGQELRGLSPIKRQRLLKKIVKSPVLSADYLNGPRSRYVSGGMREGPGGNRRQGGAGSVSAGENNLGEDQEPKLLTFSMFAENLPLDLENSALAR